LGAPSGNSALGNISVNTLTINEPAHGSTGSSLPPVFLGEERVLSHKGKRKQLIGFEFRFNGVLDPASAQSISNYRVTQKHGKKGKVLRVKSAFHNPSNSSVTISVAGFNTGKTAEVTITGLVGADEAAIPGFVSRL
jgi:hypothetical protein